MGDYQFISYAHACDRIEAIGRGFLSLGLHPGEKILIFAETRPEWLLSALAAFRHGFPLVTLYSTLGDEAVKHGINESQVQLILTSQELTFKLEVRRTETNGEENNLALENFGFDAECSTRHLFSEFCSNTTRKHSREERQHRLSFASTTRRKRKTSEHRSGDRSPLSSLIFPSR